MMAARCSGPGAIGTRTADYQCIAGIPGVIAVTLAATVVMLNAQLLMTSFIFGEALKKLPELLVSAKLCRLPMED
jgi:hypothetical protein